MRFSAVGLKRVDQSSRIDLELADVGFDPRNTLKRLDKCSSLDVVDCQRPEVETLGGRRKRRFRSPFSQLHHRRAVFLHVIYDH
jgi:hypothetical protein